MAGMHGSCHHYCLKKWERESAAAQWERESAAAQWERESAAQWVADSLLAAADWGLVAAPGVWLLHWVVDK
jgi:hypothetical protein